MKICLVSDFLVGYHKNWSGAEMVGKILSEALKEEEQKLAFITTKFGENKNGEEVYQLPTFINNPRLLKKFTAPFYMIIGAFFSVYYLLKMKPDVIHLLHTNYLFLPVILGAKLLRMPTVFTFLDYYLICPRATFRMANGIVCQELEGKNCLKCISLIRLFERYLMKFFSKRLDGVITFTKTSKKRLIRHGFREEKIKIIYTYNIPKEFASKTKTVKNKNVLFIGSFHEHKGLRIVVQAIPDVLLQLPEARFQIIGSGNEFDKNEINELISSLQIKNNIDFIGQKGNEEVLNLILESSLVVVSEQWPSEFGPLALVEAMALGRPVVSGNLGSPSDFINSGENGFIVDFNQPKQYAEKIIQVLKNKETAEDMGKKAKEAGKLLFDYNQGKEHVDLYQKIV